MTMPECKKCGISNLSVTITATCTKCKAAVALCNTCKLAWNIKNCPSCGASPIIAKWTYRDVSGSGTVSDSMLSYLDSVGLAPKGYVNEWNAAKEQRLAEREKDGDSAHRGVPLPPVEVDFLRKMEDFMFEPIFTVADSRGNYAVVEDGHVVKLRLLNADVRKNMPDTISAFELLREFRYEKLRGGKGELSALPETFKDCPSLEILVLQGTAVKLPNEGLSRLKYLAVPGMGDISAVFRLTSLEELSLSGCYFKQGELEKLGDLINLRKLQLSYIQMQGGVIQELPDSMKNLVKLEELDVRGLSIGKFASSAWPEWLAELPSLKLVHKNPDSLHGWGPVEAALHQRNPEGHLGNVLDPEMASRKMNLTDINNWWKENNSEALMVGWTGIAPSL